MVAHALRAILLGAVLALATDAFAQTTPRPPVGGFGSPADAMIFYVAHGAEGACGRGCSDWIAAEGTVQWDTFKRLIAILDRQTGSPVEPDIDYGKRARVRGYRERSALAGNVDVAFAARLTRNIQESRREARASGHGQAAGPHITDVDAAGRRNGVSNSGDGHVRDATG